MTMKSFNEQLYFESPLKACIIYSCNRYVRTSWTSLNNIYYGKGVCTLPNCNTNFALTVYFAMFAISGKQGYLLHRS